MGTREGTRTRKYHSFLASIAGRLEKNFLAHLDLSIHGTELWTHAYNSPEQTVFHPDGAKYLTHFQSQPWPMWTWQVPEGILEAQLTALTRGGFEFRLKWTSSAQSVAAPLVVRPLWAMRRLHAVGAQAVHARMEGPFVHFRSRVSHDDVWIHCDRPFDWRPNDTWYKNFYYREEHERGYPSNEDLFCAGQFEITLQHGESVRLQLRTSAQTSRQQRSALPTEAHALSDFILHEPPGIVAGFPWFGEWGRDTFIALPGIMAGIYHHDPDVISWAVGVLERWSGWIESDGMIPNLITTEGPQWESADGTLWWTHALASLWALGTAKPETGLLDLLPERFGRTLFHAISAIRLGRHKHLQPARGGMLEVTSSHSTWMDARINNEAATPRVGALPEINALWFQARCLHELWSRQHNDSFRQEAEALLSQPMEPERPNFVFLHSIPLAPCLFASNTSAVTRDAHRLRDVFATPVGLRTLSPQAQKYTAQYCGGAVERDYCYHQGPAWGWLKGHYDMARQRFKRAGLAIGDQEPQGPLSSIEGHFAELFDAEAPFAHRGAPAQAWSSACRAEAAARAEWKVDEVLIRIIEGHFK